MDYPEHIETVTLEHEPHKQRTIKSLRLNLDAAMQGRYWELLPEGFREQSCGNSYPLPSSYLELQRLCAVPIPSTTHKDASSVYLRRALREGKRKLSKKQSALLDMERREYKIRKTVQNFTQKAKELRNQMHYERDRVREKADEVIATLADLFALGRKGLEGQMKAHLDGQPWQGEAIDAHAFRDCFRMVAQSVVRMGLPSTERKHAQEAIIEEAAASLRDTQEALALAPGNTDETAH